MVDPLALAQYKAEAARNADLNRSFPIIIYTFLGIFLTTCTLLERWRARRNRSFSSRLSRWDVWISTHLSIPPLHSTHHLVPHNGRTFPTRAQALFVVIYMTIHLTLFSLPFETVPESQPEIPSRASQAVKYLALRAGSLIFLQLPLLALTGSPARSYADSITRLTGITRESINVTHRWLGRTAWYEVLAHVALYFTKICFINPHPGRTTLEGVWDGIKRILIVKVINQYGFLAFLAMCMLAIPSVKAVRAANGVNPPRQLLAGYETFLFFHIIGIIALSFCAFMHIYMSKQSKQWWVVAYACIWLFDRIRRLGKQRIALGSAVLYDAGVIRLCLDVPLKKRENAESLRRAWSGPGKVIHLSVGGWKNTHPFSVADVRDPRPVPGHESAVRLVLHMRALQGFTKEMWSSYEQRHRHPMNRGSRLFNASEASNEDYTQDARMSLLSTISTSDPRPQIHIEGPYGSPQPLHRFDSVLLISGGVGAALVVPYLEELMCPTRSQPTRNRRKRIRFVWAVREAQEIELFRSRLGHILSNPNPEIALVVEIYVTRNNTSASQTIDPWISHSGRPSLGDLVKEEIVGDIHVDEEEPLAEGDRHSLAIMACGSAVLLDAVRFTVAETTSAQWKINGRGWARTGPSVDVEYYENGYSW